jgi:c-di-GMP-binding flagellar brake protein YcgR
MRVARQAKSRTATRGAQERDRNGNGNESAFHGATRVSNRAQARTRERRAYERAQMALALSVRRIAGQPSSEALSLRTIDISSSGALFLYPERIEPGTPLRIEVTLIEERLRHRAVRMCTDAHVVRAQSNGKPGWHALAVAFDEIGYVRDEHLPPCAELSALPHSDGCD